MSLVSSINPVKISKTVKFSGKNISETVQTATQPITQQCEKVAAKSTSIPLTAIPEFNLTKKIEFQTFSETFKKEINQFRQSIWNKLSSDKNQHKLFTNIDSFLETLVHYCPDEKVLKQIISNDKKFTAYINIKSKMNKLFKNCDSLNFQDKQEVLTKLSAMRIVNPESFKALWKSKGMDEIYAKRLNISYLKDINPLGKYDENFFYKMFETLENNANERLLKSGLNPEIINKYFSTTDKEICLNPKFRDEFITKLDEIKKPEIVNQILNKIDPANPLQDYDNELLNKILEQAKSNPEAVQKALKIESNLFGTMETARILSSKESKIDDEIFNMYLDFKKKNPNCTSNWDIPRIDNLLNIPNTDKKMLENLFSIATKNDAPFYEIVEYANEHNISYIKECLEKGTINAKDNFFIKALSNNPKNPQELSKIYDELYIPMQKIFKENNINENSLDRLIQLKTENAPIYKELEDNKILELVMDRKISPNILTTLYGDIKIPQYILDDVKKIQNGESLIKKFTSVKEAVQKSYAGDVVSIDNKLYINDNGKLSLWNMSEEKFNELFPLVDRFANKQGWDDCYFSTIAKSLYENPKSRGHYYKMFEQKGNDICVTIPAYKDFSGEIIFPNGEIKTSASSGIGAKHFQMFEQTYGRTAVRGTDCRIEKSALKDSILTDDLEYLNKRIQSGQPIDVIREIFPEEIINGKISVQDIMKKSQAEEAIKNYAGNPRYILTNGYYTRGNNGHVVAIKSYNPKTDIVTISDPANSGVIEEMPLTKILDKFIKLNFVRLR